MAVAFLRQGRYLLPGNPGITQILKTCNGKTPVEIKTVAADETLGLTYRVGLLPHCDWAGLKVDRMLKKTSERQSCWLINTGFRTWRDLYGPQDSAQNTGLFLGLATVDCDDDQRAYCFTDSSSKTIADAMLREIKPLSVLTLLNTTAGSHLATLLGIKGPNAAFSPHADAGAAAVAEAYFNTVEGRCRRALCGASSQKITFWYFLEYEYLLQNYKRSQWFPTEAAAFVGMDTVGTAADGILLSVKRTGSYRENNLLPGLDRLLTNIDGNNSASPQQIIHTGTITYNHALRAESKHILPTAHQLFLDSIIGYTGPASAIIAINIALELFKRNITVDQRGTAQSITLRPLNSVLIVSRGLEGQIIYLLIGNVS